MAASSKLAPPAPAIPPLDATQLLKRATETLEHLGIVVISLVADLSPEQFLQLILALGLTLLTSRRAGALRRGLAIAAWAAGQVRLQRSNVDLLRNVWQQRGRARIADTAFTMTSLFGYAAAVLAAVLRRPASVPDYLGVVAGCVGLGVFAVIAGVTLTLNQRVPPPRPTAASLQPPRLHRAGFYSFLATTALLSASVVSAVQRSVRQPAELAGIAASALLTVSTVTSSSRCVLTQRETVPAAVSNVVLPGLTWLLIGAAPNVAASPGAFVYVATLAYSVWQFVMMQRIVEERRRARTAVLRAAL